MHIAACLVAIVCAVGLTLTPSNRVLAAAQSAPVALDPEPSLDTSSLDASDLDEAHAGHLDTVMTASDRRHLLARTGFGVPPAEFQALDGLSRQQGIDKIITGLNTLDQKWSVHSACSSTSGATPSWPRCVTGGLPRCWAGVRPQQKDSC